VKKILITGMNSYVGNRLEKWLERDPDHYLIDKISLRDATWKEKDLSTYDVVVHVAGIAHQKETKENAHLYYKVNRELAFEVAKRAKAAEVKQFIFLSSMSVYGLESGIIDENTPLNPKSHYGKSKLQAEELINDLAGETFKTAIVRPPMIYGKGCKGNYQRLRKLALKTPIFPDIDNERSMIYIDNLSEFIKILIEKASKGIFFPQNKEYVNTTEMVKTIAENHRKQLKLTRVCNPIINLFNAGVIQKVFGNLVYAETLSDQSKMQCNSFIDFNDSIKLTEE